MGGSGVLDDDLRGGNWVALGGEAGVTLGKDDNALDEAPDAVAEEDEVAEHGDEAEEDSDERDAGGQGGENGAEDGDDEATTEEADMEETFLIIAEVPIVRAKAAEENAKEAGGSSGLRDDVGWLAGLGRGWITSRGGWIAGWVGLLVLHRNSLFDEIDFILCVSFIILLRGGKSKMGR